MDEKILVTGATGKQGGAVARHLLKAGFRVRALTRHPDKAADLAKSGAEIVRGDLTDHKSVERALEGIRKMFLVTTPFEAGIEAEMDQGITAVDTARARGVDHLFFSSVGGADKNTGISHFDSKWQIEEHIRKLNLRATILRPVFFMENFGSSWLLGMLQKGELVTPLKSDRKLAMVAVDDIGAYAAAAFLDPMKFVEREIELAGDELTYPQALDQISKVSGKKIVYRELPTDQAEKMMGKETATMYAWFNQVGYSPDIEGLKGEFGVPLTTFSEYIKSAPWISKLSGEPIAKGRAK